MQCTRVKVLRRDARVISRVSGSSEWSCRQHPLPWLLKALLGLSKQSLTDVDGFNDLVLSSRGGTGTVSVSCGSRSDKQAHSHRQVNG